MALLRLSYHNFGIIRDICYTIGEMPADELWGRLQDAQAALEAQADRIEALYTAHGERLAALETAAGQRIRGLEAQVGDQTETLKLAGETMQATMDVCRRHGYDPACGLSALEWLEFVLDNAAAGWPSVN